MTDKKPEKSFEEILRVLSSGTLEDLDDLTLGVDGFPHGVDSVVGRRWIINAIDEGSLLSIKWMLSKGVDLNFCDDEGQTVLLAAIDREVADRLEVLELLLIHGAPANLQGIYEMAPAHLAALRNDVGALQILVRHGADLSMRDCNRDHDRGTPLENAEDMDATEAIEYLKEVTARKCQS